MAGCMFCAESSDRPAITQCIDCKAGLCVEHIIKCEGCGKAICRACQRENKIDLCKACLNKKE